MKNRSFLLLMVMSLLLPTKGFSIKETKNFVYSVFYDEYWGSKMVNENRGVRCIRGSYNKFSEGISGAHPSDFYWRLTIDGLKDCKKSERDMKHANKYKGTLEYYVSETDPTLKSLLKSGNLRWPGAVKKTMEVDVYIKPYKHNPQLYMIFFQSEGETCGFAIELLHQKNGLPAVLDW